MERPSHVEERRVPKTGGIADRDPRQTSVSGFSVGGERFNTKTNRASITPKTRFRRRCLFSANQSSGAIIARMAAIINQATGTRAFTDNKKPELVQKIEGQAARVLRIRIITKEEGFVTINEDKSLRVILKRDNGQFWPSSIEYLPSVPASLCFHEESKLVFVGTISGTIHQYAISEDMNKLEHTRQWNAHLRSVNGLIYSANDKMLFSCSRDGVIWHSVETAMKIGNYTTGSPCTVMQYDPTTSFAFVGDYSGSVYVLRVVGNTAQLVSKLSAHTATISDIAWDSSRQVLFSAATDHLVIMWDIGGKKGQCYELNGHDSKLSCLALAQDASKLFSVDDTGHLVCWDLKPKRSMAPPWRESDKCELCDVPFFWNLKTMWERKTVGVRRHHCRICGTSICSNCCGHSTTFPAMGYEKPARICNTCHQKMQTYPDQFDLTPLAIQSELRQGVIDMNLDVKSGRLVTVGYDRIIMIWNVASML